MQQLSLFEVPPVHTELVQTLHLPSPGSPTNASLFLDDQSEQEVRVTNTQVIASEEGLHLLVKSLRAFGAFALDTETSSDEPRRAELVGISLAAVPGEAYYIPVGHTTSLEDQKQLPLTFVIEKLKPLLEDATVAKYMHNAKYDLAILARYGINLLGLKFDTMLGAYLTDPGPGIKGSSVSTFEPCDDADY